MRMLRWALVVCGAVPLGAQPPGTEPPDSADQALRAVVAAAAWLPFDATPLTVTPSTPDFAIGMVSWVASTAVVDLTVVGGKVKYRRGGDVKQ